VASQVAALERDLEGFRGGNDELAAQVEQVEALSQQNEGLKKQVGLMCGDISSGVLVCTLGERGEEEGGLAFSSCLPGNRSLSLPRPSPFPTSSSTSVLSPTLHPSLAHTHPPPVQNEQYSQALAELQRYLDPSEAGPPSTPMLRPMVSLGQALHAKEMGAADRWEQSVWEGQSVGNT
jgi:hypothetical protein